MRYNKRRLNTMIKRMLDLNIGNYTIDSDEAMIARVEAMTDKQRNELLDYIEANGLWPEPVQTGNI